MEEVSEIPYLTNPDADADPALAPLQAAACTYRIALGPRAGQKVLTWKDPSLRLASPEAPQSPGCVSPKALACMRIHIAAPSSDKNSNVCAATLRVRPWATNACAVHQPARSSSNSKPRTAMAPPTS